MRVRVLGPLEVSGGDGRSIDLGGPRQRRLLCALALARGEPVSEDRLIDAVWKSGDGLPESPRRALQTYISRLRATLGADAIRTFQSGYGLHPDTVEVDVTRFESLVVSAGRARDSGDVQGAAAAMSEALALWRGEPFVDLDDAAWAEPERRRLAERRLQAEEQHLALLLQCGALDEVVPDAEALAAREPLREAPRRVLMVALYRSGRHAEALRVYHEYRRYLIDETGLEPSTELAELERRIVDQDPRLNAEFEGRRIRGYILGDKIAEGAFGDVYRGVQPSVGREVAIKVIRAELADDPEFVRRFESEAQLIAHLEHPHIVPVVDFWREPGSAYLVMRYLRGGTAQDRLQRDGPWPLDDVTRLVDEVGSALAVAHASGIVHHDVKAANILFDEIGNSYLTDFGVAIVRNTVPDERDHEETTRLADIADLAAVFHQLLSGTNDNRAASVDRARPLPSLVARRPDLPSTLDTVLQTATAGDRSARFADMAEFVLAFRGAVRGADARPGTGADDVHRHTAGPPLASLRATAVNPYKGLRPFEEADALSFFGRDQLVDELVRHLASSRFVAVVGPSGSGKSSVVRAGLIPHLRRSGAYIAVISPGVHPMRELETALMRISTQPMPTLLEQLGVDEGAIGRCAGRILPNDDRELVLVIDQFEELYTITDRADRDQFLIGIAEAVGDECGRLRVVATLRADFVDRPLLDPTVSELVRDNTQLVTPLNAAGLRLAITAPAERVGLTVEADLVAELISSAVGHAGSLPLLQYALTETYEHRDGNHLTLEGYQRTGGLSAALAQRADQIYGDLSPDDQQSVRRLFTRLITPGDGADDTRQRVRRTELAGIDPDVIDIYGEARLLSFDRDPATREPTVEVAHEALIRSWPRLRDWVDEDRDGLRALRHLATTAHAWSGSGRDDAELYRGGRLEGAEQFAAEHPDVLNEVEQQFLGASVGQREREVATERRRLRRLRGLLAAVALIAVIAVIAGAIAFQQRNRSRDARTESDLRRLVAESANQIESDRRLGLLMAVEAHRIDPSPDTLGAIQRVLVNAPTNWLGSLSGATPYTGAAFLDTTTLAALGPHGLDIWDLGTRTVTNTVDVPAEAGQLVVSDDRTLLAVGHQNGTWEILDTDGFAVVENGDIGTPVYAIALDSDGTRAAVGGIDGIVTITDIAGLGPDRVIDQGFRVEDLAFDPSGRLLAVGTGSLDGSAAVFDATTGEALGPDIRVEGGADIVAWHDRGLFVAMNHTGAVFDPLTGGAVLDGLQLEGTYSVVGRSQTVNGGVILLSSEGMIERLSAGSDQVDVVGADSQVGDIQAVTTDPSGATVAAVGAAGISLFSTDGRGTLAVRTLPTTAPAVDLSEDGSIAMTSDSFAERLTDIWNLADPASPPETLEPYRQVLGSHDSFYLVGWEPTSPIVSTRALWQDRTLAPITAGPAAPSLNAALSPDGTTLVVDNGRDPTDGMVTVIDLSSDEVVARLDAIRRDDDVDGNLHFAADIEFSPDGGLLVITTWRGGVHFYDTDSWTSARASLRPGDGFMGIDFTSDGTRALTLDWDRREIELRDASTFDVVFGPKPAITSINVGGQSPDITADDRHAIVGGGPTGATLLDLETLEAVGEEFPYIHTPWPASLAAEANLLATATDHGTVIWNVDVDEWPQIACRAAGRNMTHTEWTQVGPADEAYRATCATYPGGI
jgi:DNA-binding SARP family transcriptional activator/WD40 repeat protein/tRNA A-37 threonylcarbamoyl transferase component Bud32